MENIYVGHSRDFDYVGNLYTPLRKSRLNKYFNLILPHENSDEPFSSKDFFKTCRYMIAEVSSPATGLGIELGWADVCNVDIICIYRKGSRPSTSLNTISNAFIEYENEKDLIDKLESLILTYYKPI